MTGNELINSVDFDEMLCKLSKDEALTESELHALEEYVSHQIHLTAKKRSLEDLFAALTVVSKTDHTSLGYLVEQCMEIPDPLLISLSIEILVHRWDMGEQYEERLIQFLLGVPYDHDGDIKEISIRCIGSLVKKRIHKATNSSISLRSISPHDKRLVLMILQAAEDPLEDTYIRNAAYETLILITSGLPGMKNISEKEKNIDYLKSYFSVSSSSEDESDMCNAK
jgi:hypothetical protein